MGFIGLVSSKNYYKRPGRVVGVCGKGNLDVSFLRGAMCAERMGCGWSWVMCASGNRDCQLASRSVLKDFTEDALTISAGNLFQNGTARMAKAYWRRRGTASLLAELIGVAA